MSSHKPSRHDAAIDATSGVASWLVRNLTRPFAASAVLGAVFTPAIAAAQNAPEDVNTVTFDLEARYDSNIARSTDARASLRGLNRSDVRLSPTITVDFSRGFGRSRVNLSGSVAYDFFAKNDQLNRERIGLKGGALTQAGPCTPSVNFALIRRQSDLGDIAFIAGSPLLNVKNTETVQRYGADLACGNEFGLRPFVGIEYEKGTNSADIRERADFDATRYSTGLRYVSPTFGEISLFASRRDVDRSAARVLGDSGEYRQTNYGASFSRNLGTRFDVFAQVAFSDVNTRSGAGGGFSGLTWNLQGTAIAGTRLRLTAAVGREISNNLSSDATFVVRSPYSLRAMYAFSDRLQADAGISYTRQRYKYAILPALIFIQKDSREIYDAGVSYKFARRLRLRVSGGHERRNADNGFFDFSNTFAIAAIGFTL